MGYGAEENILGWRALEPGDYIAVNSPRSQHPSWVACWTLVRPAAQRSSPGWDFLMQAVTHSSLGAHPQHLLHASALTWLCEHVVLAPSPLAGLAIPWRIITYCVSLSLQCLGTWSSSDVWKINQ